jgi:glyoxylase-like metal-dependent hydrolase (beta-lactamase superfamily II)
MRLIRIATGLVLTASAVSAQNGTPALDAALQAMGGRERVLAVRTLILEGTGTNLNFGQNVTPYAESQFEVTAFRRSIDFANRRWFLDQTRVPRFTTGNMNPQRQRQGLDGMPNGIAYNIGGGAPPAPGQQPPATMTRAGAQVAADRMHEFIYHPIGFAKAALIAGTQVTEESAPRNQRRVRLTMGGNTYAMYVDSKTNLPVRIERMVYQAMLGDVALNTEFANWQDVGGVRLPMRITQKYENLFTISDITLASAKVNEDVGNIGVTDSIRAVAQQAGAPAGGAAPPAPTIAVDTLAPGVWRIGGQSHHTIAIEQSNQVVLVEAPQSDARTLAAIARARQLRPGKALGPLINTHHHFDHSGGIRAAMSEGLTIVTHDGNKDFYKTVHSRQHTSQPDALQRSPKPLKLSTVGDRRVLKDNLRTIEILHVPGNAHNGNMLVVYLPAEKILIQADLYNPPAANAVNPVFPFAGNLLEMIQKRRLQVDRLVGIHGNPVAFADFQAAATRAP